MKYFLAVLLALPLCANATLIYVQFEGAVTRSLNEQYAVGDPISGELTIDSDLAGPLLDDGIGNIGDRYYGAQHWPSCSCSEDFVTGFLDGSGKAYDTVYFGAGEDPEGPPSVVQIVNMYSRDTPDERNFSIFAGYDNLDGYSLEQSFELRSTPDEGPVARAFLNSSLGRGSGGPGGFVEIALSYFSMTPTPGKFTCSR